ncbi:MAG: A/G-specific adenine glycosylase [Prevotella sp.]
MPHNHFTTTLVSWYRQHGRDLPWRHTRNPYAIWLSEVIMQQTRIAQGRAYWERFISRFPTVDSLASASEDEVLRMWQGLGYYSRARNLHEAARQIVSRGSFPDNLADIRRLKGVGTYTAAAIASFAFGIRAAAVDGNAYRVLSRVFAIDTPVNSTEGKYLFQQLADSLMADLPAAEEAGNFNQAMMDFGATCCTPKAPKCPECPFMATCEALHSGRIAELPVKNRTTKVKERRMAYVFISCQGYCALHRRGAGDIWQSLWEPCVFEGGPLPEWEGTLTLLSSNVRHVLTHRVILADFYLLQTDARPELPADFVWIKQEDVSRYAVPRLVERLLEAIGRRGLL